MKKINIKKILAKLANITKNRDFSKINLRFFTRLLSIAGLFLFLLFIFICFEVYAPINPLSKETIAYTVPKGWGDEKIAQDLKNLNIIRSAGLFKLYVLLSLKHADLKAGRYNLSSRMSIYQIAQKIAGGDVLKDKLVIPEGWSVKDMEKYFESKNICQKDEFISLAKNDYSQTFEFLKDIPRNIGVEGFLYPDTYEVSSTETCEDVLKMMLANFDKKIAQGTTEDIALQNKSLFKIITMASIIEKEVRNLEDKKIVSGLLWRRIEIDMPLQVDATINYITDKNDPSATIADTKIDSPYNTYKYKGLPKGPISNPGLDSILAAISPTKTQYLFYLSASSGKTIFSKTLEEHRAARIKYLN